MKPQENLAIVKKLYETFDSHNLKNGEKYIDERCEFINVPFNVKAHGINGYNQSQGGWISAFPDARCEISNMIATEEYVITEFTGVGTHKGVFMAPEGEIQPTGKRVAIDCVEVAKIKNGKVVQSKLYFDTLRMLNEIGVVKTKELLSK